MERRTFLVTAAAAALPVPAFAAQGWTPGIVKLPEWRGPGWRQAAVLIRGCWAIEQVGEPDDMTWTLFHIPTQTRAAWSEDKGVMEQFAGVLDGLTDFSKVTTDEAPTMAKQVYDAGHAAGLVRWGSCAWSRA